MQFFESNLLHSTHLVQGLKIMAEDGNVTMLVREMAERKVAGHLESYGSAWADPSKPLEATKGQKIHFGFYASPGDYLNLATKLVRSNDRYAQPSLSTIVEACHTHAVKDTGWQLALRHV